MTPLVFAITGTGQVDSVKKIFRSNFTNEFAEDGFGVGISNIGDLNNDGIDDLAVGAPGADDGGENHGALWVLFLYSNSTVKSFQKISETSGNFTGSLSGKFNFGLESEGLGDLNNDGVKDIAVGSTNAVWILFLNNNGTVKSTKQISIPSEVGRSITNMGDLDNDGIIDIAVGKENDDDGGSSRGAVSFFFLNNNGTVKNTKKISNTVGNFTGLLNNVDHFGYSVENIGDFNSDGLSDIAIGSYNDHDGQINNGAVWLLYLNNDQTVKNYKKISDTQGNFAGQFTFAEHFGSHITNISDFNGDGVTDIIVGSRPSIGGPSPNIWYLFMNQNGTVKSHFEDQHGFQDETELLRDLDGNGVREIASGAYGENGEGSVWIQYMSADSDNDGVRDLDDKCPGFNDKIDFDSDGIPNDCDTFPNDFDNDGIDVLIDNCPVTTNPTQSDIDGDTQGDACDPFPNDPNNDIDGDGVSGDIDNCPTTSNGDQADTDGDLIGNLCDSTPNGDSDHDTIDNLSDNCPSIPNTNQANADADSLGDACDSTPNGDTDGDGIDNLVDNCPVDFNASQTDNDYDGLGNVCDSTPVPVNCSPTAGNWIITSTCALANNEDISGNVELQNNSVLIIPNGKTLNIDFAHKHLLIKSGSKVVIKSGGKIN